jgi:hypothetical protein
MLLPRPLLLGKEQGSLCPTASNSLGLQTSPILRFLQIGGSEPNRFYSYRMLRCPKPGRMNKVQACHEPQEHAMYHLRSNCCDFQVEERTRLILRAQSPTIPTVHVSVTPPGQTILQH